MVFARRPELLPRLRGNNIVMSVKVENAFSLSIVGNQADGAFGVTPIRLASFQSLAFESPLPQSVFEQISASTIILPRRVSGTYATQLGPHRSPPVLARFPPG